MIQLLKNNNNIQKTDCEWMQEFFDFLQGDNKTPVVLSRGRQPKMSKKKAFAIIYYLQEHLPVFSDHIEVCDVCKDLFDTEQEGTYWETKGKHYCGCCEDIVPPNADNRLH